MMQGCELSHKLVKIPLFTVTVSASDQSALKSIYVVVPEYYGETGAFISLITGKLENNTFYKWKEVSFSKTTIGKIEINEGRRYIGSMFPFSLSQDTMKSRVVFISSKERDAIYKIKITGSHTGVYVTSLKKSINHLPQSYAEGKSSESDKSSLRKIREENDYYKKVQWEETGNIKIIKLNRSNEFDEVEISLDG